MTNPTTTDSGIDLDELTERIIQSEYEAPEWMSRDFHLIIERLRATEVMLRIERDITKQQTERNDSLRERLRAAEEHSKNWYERAMLFLKSSEETQAKLAAAETANKKLWALSAEYQHTIERIEGTSGGSTLYKLEAKLATAEADHEKDKQAWMAENTELLTQVQALTAELTDMSHTDYLGRTRLDITNDSLAVRKLNGELRKQVERLIAERDEAIAAYERDMREGVRDANVLREQVERLTVELEVERAKK